MYWKFGTMYLQGLLCQIEVKSVPQPPAKLLIQVRGAEILRVQEAGHLWCHPPHFLEGCPFTGSKHCRQATALASHATANLLHDNEKDKHRAQISMPGMRAAKSCGNFDEMAVADSAAWREIFILYMFFQPTAFGLSSQWPCGFFNDLVRTSENSHQASS